MIGYISRVVDHYAMPIRPTFHDTYYTQQCKMAGLLIICLNFRDESNAMQKTASEMVQRGRTKEFDLTYTGNARLGALIEK